MNLFGFAFPKRHLSEEAFWAYYHRLPDSIQVRWFRDGDLIIGEVNDGKKKFFTQGKDADNFIIMVNDALITAYNIPQDYFEFVRKSKMFSPKPDERRRLENIKIKKATFGSKKIPEKELSIA